MLKEVGFWRDTRALRHDKSSSITERTLLLFSSTVISAKDQLPSEDDGDQSRPDPTQLTDYRWFVTHSPLIKMLEWYLTEGACIESHELAYSYCRFPRCSAAAEDPQALGACTLTDGVYVWPEGYWHYIRSHYVRPPQDFLDHVATNYRRVLLAMKALSREFGDDVLWLWDADHKRPVPMPNGMQEWILANTTVRLPGSSYQRSNPVGGRLQTWDHLASRMPSCCECIIS